MHNEQIDAQTAMNQAANMLKASYDDFVEAEAHLAIVTQNHASSLDILEFIQGCKDIVMGNVWWRYSLSQVLFPFKN
jgi:hypothetical protein